MLSCVTPCCLGFPIRTTGPPPFCRYPPSGFTTANGGGTKTLKNNQKEILSPRISIECISLSRHCELLKKKKKLGPTIVSIYISGLLPLQPARGAFFCPLLWCSRGTVQFRNLTRIGAVQVQRRMRTKLGHSTRYAGVGVSAVPGGSAAPPSPAIFLSLSLRVSGSTPQYPATDSVSGLSLVSVPIIDENIIDLIF